MLRTYKGRKSGKSSKKKALLTIITFVVSVVLVSLFTSKYKFAVVSGNSMLPTLKDGSVLIVQNIEELQNDNLYIVKPPNTDYVVIKRLRAMPGDVLELKAGDLYRNGTLIKERSGNVWDTQTFTPQEWEYVFLGDNMEESSDSRYWNRLVDRREILYEVVWCVYPLSSFGSVR